MTTAAKSDRTKTSISLPRLLLHAEGIAVFISSLLLYWFIGGNWWLFFALLLAPDLVFIIYMANKPVGTIAYNLVHSYTVPIFLAAIALINGWQLGIVLAVIWFAHIGMDRAIGYGLKYQTGFKETHINRA